MQDYVVSSFAVDVDLIVFLENYRHSFPIAVELYYVQDFVANHLVGSSNTHFVVFIDSDVLPTAILGHVDEGQFVWRGGVVLFIALFIFFNDDVVAKG